MRLRQSGREAVPHAESLDLRWMEVLWPVEGVVWCARFRGITSSDG